LTESNNDISALPRGSGHVPKYVVWKEKYFNDLLDELREILYPKTYSRDTKMSKTLSLFLAAMSQICNPVLTFPCRGSEFWKPFRNGEKDLLDDFFGV